MTQKIVQVLYFISMNYKNIGLYNVSPVNNDKIFLFDIDDTLYKSSLEMERVDHLAWKSAYEIFKKNKPDAPSFDDILKSYPTYIEAFKVYFGKTPFETEKARNFNYQKYLKKDENLKQFLDALPYRKWCFTNGNKSRAKAILEPLDLCDTFEGVICMDDDILNGQIRGKPQEEMYRFVEDLLGINNKKNVYFFDDSIRNIETGKKMGWNCYLIKKEDVLLTKLQEVLISIRSEPKRKGK